MEVNFPNFKKIRSNFNYAFIIQFGYFWAVILQFLALRNPLPKFFLNKICSIWYLKVCANTLSLPEHFLTPWVFIWNHSNIHMYYAIGRSWQDLAQTKVEFVPVPPWTEAYYFVVNKIQEYSWICRPESSVKMLSRAPYKKVIIYIVMLIKLNKQAKITFAK